MTLWEAALLGIVQGLTEFLPISSTAHLVVARQLLGHPETADGFTTVIQLGTLVAVFWYFRRDIWKLLIAVIGDVKAKSFCSTNESRLAWLIVLGSVPVILVGMALGKVIKQKLYDPTSIAIVAVVFSILMLAAEIWHRNRRENLKKSEIAEANISWREALWMGLWQALALMPGASRSGTTITGGLFAGLERSATARFSFLLSLPAILGAGLKEIFDEYKLYKNPAEGSRESLFASSDDVAALLLGTAVAGVVGYWAIAWLMRFLKTSTLMVFVVYRLILAVAILALVWKGLIR